MSKCKKCVGNCVCIDKTSKMEKLKGIVKEMVKQAMKEVRESSIEEVSVSGGVAGPSTPYAFGNRGKKIGTASMPGSKATTEDCEEEGKNESTTGGVQGQVTPLAFGHSRKELAVSSAPGFKVTSDAYGRAKKFKKKSK